jgi:hypothetical protein
LADSLFGAKKYYEASIACERLLFDYGNSGNSYHALMLKIQCYKQLGRFKDAVSELERFSLPQKTDSLTFQVLYEKVLCHYLSKNYSEADYAIAQMSYLIKDSTLSQPVALLGTLINNELANWEKARLFAIKWVNYCKTGSNEKEMALARIEKFYSAKSRPHLKSPNRAKNFSTYLPGLGQVYAGSYVEGVSSLLLQAGFIGFGVSEIVKANYLSGYIFGFSFFQRFYFGGARRAEFLVEKKNYEKIRQFSEEIKAELVKIKTPD